MIILFRLLGLGAFQNNTTLPRMCHFEVSEILFLSFFCFCLLFYLCFCVCLFALWQEDPLNTLEMYKIQTTTKWIKYFLLALPASNTSTTILDKTVEIFCNKNSVPCSPKSMQARIMHC